MSRVHKVLRLMTDAHRVALDRFLCKPQTTCDMAFDFVKKLGYRISRSAINNYARDGRIAQPEFVAKILGMKRSAAAAKIAKIAKTLSMPTLRSLALVATLLAGSTPCEQGSSTTNRTPIE